MDAQNASVAIGPAGELWPFIYPSADSRGRLAARIGFTFFILSTIVLLVRPADLVPALDQTPIYETLVACCLAISIPRLLDQFSSAAHARPITLLILGVWGFIVVSHLVHGSFDDARIGGTNFAKLFAYYLLVLAWVDSPRRLRQFLLCLCVCCVILAAVALLGYDGWISLPALITVSQSYSDTATGVSSVIQRLCGIGIFADPNDVCLILTVAVVLGFYFWGDPAHRRLRRGWFWPIALFVYAIHLTSSRMGLLSLLAAIGTILAMRYGRRRAIIAALILLPLAMFVFAGRQTEVDLSDPGDTFRTRLDRWSDSLTLFKESPIFGCGEEQQAALDSQVAHNSYLQSFAELGFFGGACFLGTFVLAIGGVYRAARRGVDSEVARCRPYVLAIVVGYAVGLMALSRTYVAPTYLILGIAAAYINLAPPARRLELSGRFLSRLAMGSVVLIMATYLFVRAMGA
jgi:O-antigen ligase